MLDYYNWDPQENEKLKGERDISFEKVVLFIEQGYLLNIEMHPNQEEYPDQHILIVEIENYAYLVPCLYKEDLVFLKTIVPSRKATRRYLGGKYGSQ